MINGIFEPRIDKHEEIVFRRAISKTKRFKPLAIGDVNDLMDDTKSNDKDAKGDVFSEIDIEPITRPDLSALENPVIQGYSEEEFKSAQASAWEKGYETGYQEAMQSLRVEILSSLQQLPKHIPQLDRMQQNFNQSIYADVAEITKQTFSKLLPHICERYGQEEILIVLENTIPLLLNEPKLVLKVHPDFVSDIEDALKIVAESSNYQGRLHVEGDEDLLKGSLLLDWGNGGLERHIPDVMDQFIRVSNRVIHQINMNIAEQKKDLAEDIEASNAPVTNNTQPEHNTLAEHNTPAEHGAQITPPAQGNQDQLSASPNENSETQSPV